MNLKKKYNDQGYIPSIYGIDANEADNLLMDFEFNKKLAVKYNCIEKEFIYKPHLLIKSFNDTIYNENILKAVKEILGSNIVCWNSLLFYKIKNKFVSFHQDLQYWKFDNSNCLTVSLALTDSNLENGCLTVVPKSHKENFNHKMSTENQGDNMLVFSQTIETKDMEKMPLILKAGEFSIHHGDLVHGSFPNKTPLPRVLFSIRYCTTDNKSKIYKTASYQDDRLTNFVKEPIVKENFSKESIEFREKILKYLYAHFAKQKFKKYNLKFLSRFAGNYILRKIYYFFN
jgi:ectoine hydroxylase-related dioxygenase (phytanoyl-CoA dioxygenase family)